MTEWQESDERDVTIKNCLSKDSFSFSALNMFAAAGNNNVFSGALCSLMWMQPRVSLSKWICTYVEQMPKLRVVIKKKSIKNQIACDILPWKRSYLGNSNIADCYRDSGLQNTQWHLSEFWQPHTVFPYPCQQQPIMWSRAGGGGGEQCNNTTSGLESVSQTLPLRKCYYVLWREMGERTWHRGAVFANSPLI